LASVCRLAGLFDKIDDFASDGGAIERAGNERDDQA
jgi:hypothetical protein